MYEALSYTWGSMEVSNSFYPYYIKLLNLIMRKSYHTVEAFSINSISINVYPEEI